MCSNWPKERQSQSSWVKMRVMLGELFRRGLVVARYVLSSLTMLLKEPLLQISSHTAMA